MRIGAGGGYVNLELFTPIIGTVIEKQNQYYHFVVHIGDSHGRRYKAQQVI